MYNKLRRPKESISENILYLENQPFNNITCHFSSSVFDKNSEMMRSILNMIAGMYVLNIKWEKFKIGFDNPGRTNLIYPTVLVNTDTKSKDKDSQHQVDQQVKLNRIKQDLSEKINAGFNQIDQTVPLYNDGANFRRKSSALVFSPEIRKW